MTSVFAIVGVAITGLVLQDFFPVDQLRVVDRQRWTVLGIALLCLLPLVGLLARTRVSNGTLYFVRYLQEGMSDWHFERLEREAKSSLDVRVISRTVSQPFAEGVLDMAHDLARIGRDLEMTMNEDDASTGFHIAPNLLWPAGVGLGYELYGEWSSLELVELAAERFVLKLKDHLPATNEDRARVTVTLDPGSAGRPVMTVLVTADLAAARKGGSVGLTEPSQWAIDARYRVAVLGAASPGAPAKVRPVVIQEEGPAPKDREDHTVVHPQVAVERCVHALRRAIHENHEAITVLFAAAVPKTVAVAIGWRLRHGYQYEDGKVPDYQKCRHESCRHPWRKLVLLHFEQSDTPSYVVTRVHRFQPLPAELLARLQPVQQ